MSQALQRQAIMAFPAHNCCGAILTLAPYSVEAYNKVLLRDIQVLTLRAGQMTTGRPTSPIPQLKRVGGDACAAGAKTIEVVQCMNRGFDGRDVSWESSASLEDLYRFGSTDAACEGYSHADDPYVLAGSCGLEHTIYSSTTLSRSNYCYGNDIQFGMISRLVWMFVAGIFLYSMWNSCMQSIARQGARRVNEDGNLGGGGNGGGGGGGGGGDGRSGTGANWYGGRASSSSSSSTSSSSSSFMGSSGPGTGFWSGFTLGGLLSNLLNRPRYGYGYGNNYYGGGFGGPTRAFGGGFGGGAGG